jgi:hypothetical protein
VQPKPPFVLQEARESIRHLRPTAGAGETRANTDSPGARCLEDEPCPPDELALASAGLELVQVKLPRSEIANDVAWVVVRLTAAERALVRTLAREALRLWAH